MKVLVVLSLALAAVLAAPTEDVNSLVVGGENAIPGEFPFIVSLQWVILTISTHVCGGVIIGPSWVISVRNRNNSGDSLIISLVN